MNTRFNLLKRVPKALPQKSDKYIEIVGSSNIRLSSMVKDAQDDLYDTLSKHYTHVGVTLIDTLNDLAELVAKKPDLVVLGMKVILLEPAKGYDASPKVWLSHYLQAHGIAYTGSNTRALAIEYDKQVAKQTVLDAGLASSAFQTSAMGTPGITQTLRFPLFVKPTNRGDSKGIDEKSVVYTAPELAAKVLAIHTDCSSDALIEEYLPGREFSVAVIRRPGTQELMAMPVEIQAPTDKRGNSFLSESVKSTDTEKVVAVTDLVLKKAINAHAIGVFKALGSRDYGRIDLRLDAAGRPNFIEANLMPGLSAHGYLARCFYLNERISYPQMILSVITLGLERAVAPLPKLTAAQAHMNTTLQAHLAGDGIQA